MARVSRRKSDFQCSGTVAPARDAAVKNGQAMAASAAPNRRIGESANRRIGESANQRISESATVHDDRREVRTAHAIGFGATRSVRVFRVEREVRGDEQIVDLLQQGKNEAHVRLLR
jgi:broad specificity polyphosphatase/5'/3'-nucleotidase SurE